MLQWPSGHWTFPTLAYNFGQLQEGIKCVEDSSMDLLGVTKKFFFNHAFDKFAQAGFRFPI